MKDPILLLHGFTGAGAAMKPLADRLDDAFDPSVPDLPGHGPAWMSASAVSSCGFAATVEHLLAGIEAPTTVLGYSLGGRLALAMAAAAPEKIARLIVVGGSPGLADPDERSRRRAADESLAAKIRERGIQWFVDHWAALPMWDSQRRNLSAAQRMELRWLRLSNSAEGLARSLEGSGQGAMEPLHQALPSLPMSVEVIVGGEDVRYRVIGESVAKLVPRGRLHVVAGAGHAVHLEQPEAVAAIVRSESR